jgi:hypothetical protein
MTGNKVCGSVCVAHDIPLPQFLLTALVTRLVLMLRLTLQDALIGWTEKHPQPSRGPHETLGHRLLFRHVSAFLDDGGDPLLP